MKGTALGVCPKCNRMLNKKLHNWSEFAAGIGVMFLVLPMIAIMFIEGYVFFGVISFAGGVATYVACVIHLYSEQRIKNYEVCEDGKKTEERS